MVRLCTHHQKQFIRVLNDIYTEVQPAPESENMDASTCSSGCSQQSTEHWNTSAPCSESKAPSSSDSDRDLMGLQSPLHAAGHTPKQSADVKCRDRTENYSSAFKRDFSELLATRTRSVSPKDSSAQGYLTTSNSSSLNFQHGTKSPEGQTTGHEQEAGVKKCEDDKDQMQGKTLADGYIAVKVANVNGSEDSLDSCLASQKNSFKALPEEAWDSGFTVNSPRRADKENALQCSSKASLHPDSETNEQDARPKQENHLHALGKTKVGYHTHPGDKSPCEHSKDGWVASGAVPPMHKASSGRTRAKTGSSSIKTARKSKRASGLRINDYDNQCDVVYISQPITECHSESQRSVSSRRTARKSTRGYYFNGECCELPTVRTLVKSSRMEERGNGPALQTDVSGVAKQSLVLSGGESSEAAHAGGQEADKRASLRLLSKGAPSSRADVASAENEPSEGSSLASSEAAYPEPLPALSAPPCPDNTHGDSPATAQPLASSSSATARSKERLCQLLEETEAGTNVPQLASSSGDQGPTEDSSREAADMTPLSLLEAACREEASPCSEIQAVPLPPAGLDTAPSLQPPATVDLALPTQVDLAHPAEPPASMDPEPPVGVDLELAGALSGEPPVSSDLELSATPPARTDLEPPVQSPASLGAEPPAGLQPADVKESMNADPEAGANGAQEGPGEQGEALLTVADLSELSEGEAAQGKSPRLCERASMDREMPPGAEISETGGKGTLSSKETPGRKQKKERRALVASDRRLRSQQFQPSSEGGAEKPGSAASLQLPCLQIKLSKSPGAKHFKREVHLGGAAAVCFPKGCFHKALLKNIKSPDTEVVLEREPEQQGGEENGIATRQSYKSMLAREGAVEAAPPAKASHSKSGEMLEIYVKANSEERSVLLPRERGTGGHGAEQLDEKPDDADEKKGGEKPDSAVDAGKVQSKDLTDSLMCPPSKNGSKHIPSKTLKHKKLALPFYNLRHSPTPVDTAKKTVSGKEAVQANPKQKEEDDKSGTKDPRGLKEVDTPAEDKPRFVEWCAEEENQELIADFNAQYMKVQKGWIQLEKEVQPVPKVKNKADKLKEIWKSKKRTRKCRASLEVQKLSPVQMLFMKAFKLSSICQWFLETTETRSLVIVKKLNTRLPGDVPPIKIPLQKYCSSSLYPSSMQAERLKKHLKKFAATTPAKNNLKNQKLWARLRESADKTEPEEAASPSQRPPCEASAEEASEDGNVQPPPSLPTQASTRILQKYSNLRGKLRAQQRLVKNERKGDSVADHPSVESKQSRKTVCINPLMSPKLALQVKADVFPAKAVPVEAAAKGRKGKSRSQEVSLPKADPRPGRKKRMLRASSSTRERPRSPSTDRLPGKKGSKVKHCEVPSKAPATRKQAAMAISNKLHKKGSSKERRISKRQLGKGRLPIQKVKENPTKRAAPPPSQEGLTKSPKPKAVGEPSSRSQKAANKKPSSGKTLTRSMKKIQESSTSHGKRKLRAKVDCSHSKRTRLDAK